MTDELKPAIINGAIVAWYGTLGPEWRYADYHSASSMTEPTVYVPASGIDALREENERMREDLEHANADCMRANELINAAVGDYNNVLAENARLRGYLERIACPTQTTDLLWWQVQARAALNGEG